MKRPVRMQKLEQLTRLVWESHARPLTGLPRQPARIAPGELGVMFLGHSSFLIQIGGKNILIDPVFATRLVVLRRARRAGIQVPDLPEIHLVLVTHAHMDHLNRPTLRRIARSSLGRTGRAPVIVVPQGVEDLVDTMGFAEVRSLTWWARTSVAGLEVTMTPARHWGARMFNDVHRHFGGYVIADDSGRCIYHCGDTAYFEGFREIGARLQPQVALLPIGAYFPDTYRAVHTSPEEALQGFLDLGAETMIPMHFGTFRLGREPMEEPPVRLMAEAERLHIADRVKVLAEGETLVLPARQSLHSGTGIAPPRAARVNPRNH